MFTIEHYVSDERTPLSYRTVVLCIFLNGHVDLVLYSPHSGTFPFKHMMCRSFKSQTNRVNKTPLQSNMEMFL